MLNLEKAKYIFTITGGGFTYLHDLYVIESDGTVLHTEDFDIKNIEDASPKEIFALKKDLDFTKYVGWFLMDSPKCDMFEVENRKLQFLYTTDLNNSFAANKIHQICKILQER